MSNAAINSPGLHDAHVFTTSQARVHFADLCDKVTFGGERFVITRHAHPVMAFVPLQVLPLLKKIDQALFGKEIDTVRHTAVETREQFATICNKVERQHARVIITKQGLDCLAIIPIASLEAMRLLQDLLNAADASMGLQDARKNGTRSLQELKESLGI